MKTVMKIEKVLAVTCSGCGRQYIYGHEHKCPTTIDVESRDVFPQLPPARKIMDKIDGYTRHCETTMINSNCPYIKLGCRGYSLVDTTP